MTTRFSEKLKVVSFMAILAVFYLHATFPEEVNTTMRIPVLVRRSGIPGNIKVHSVTRRQRQTFVRLLKDFPIPVSGTRPIEEAIVTPLREQALTFEELAYHILKPVLDRVPLQITVEYSEKDDSTEITASYGGERFDPAKSGDGFSYQVLRSTVKSLTYHYDPVAEQTNTVKVLI